MALDPTWYRITNTNGAGVTKIDPMRRDPFTIEELYSLKPGLYFSPMAIPMPDATDPINMTTFTDNKFCGLVYVDAVTINMGIEKTFTYINMLSVGMVYMISDNVVDGSLLMVGQEIPKPEFPASI